MEDSPEIKITNLNHGEHNNEDLQAIQDTDGTFVAEDSEEEKDAINKWKTKIDIPPITINQGTTIKIDKNIKQNAILMKKLDDIKIKIEERF